MQFLTSPQVARPSLGFLPGSRRKKRESVLSFRHHSRAERDHLENVNEFNPLWGRSDRWASNTECRFDSRHLLVGTTSPSGYDDISALTELHGCKLTPAEDLPVTLVAKSALPCMLMQHCSTLKELPRMGNPHSHLSGLSTANPPLLN